MRVFSLTVGAFQENTYILLDDDTGAAVLVDPGAEPERIAAAIRDAGAEPKAIWVTHAHLDHLGGIAGIKRLWNVPVLLHERDLPMYRAADRQAAAYGLPFEVPMPPDVMINDGDELTVGGERFVVMHTPGHSPGHVVFVGEAVIFVGDLVFQGSIGRTDLPLSEPAAMSASLDRIARLDPDLVIYPGHGPPTTLGRELLENPFLNGSARVLGG